MTNKLFYLNILAYIILFVTGHFHGAAFEKNKTIWLVHTDMEKQLVIDEVIPNAPDVVHVKAEIKEGRDTTWIAMLYVNPEERTECEVELVVNGPSLEGVVATLSAHYKKYNQ